MSQSRLIFEGWKIIFRTLRILLTRLLKFLKELFLEKAQTAQRKYQEVCCFIPPREIRARPDPYIYSQQWLRLRHLAVVYDNPDFRILEATTGTPVGRHDLRADTDYFIEATIHNNSYMAAINTSVRFDVHGFGIGTPLVMELGTVTLDVPGAGSAIARVLWHTPIASGHNCLKAHIYHPDDANPLNNVGQHNTDVARPASPTRRIAFGLGNQEAAAKLVRLEIDSYRLPNDPRCPETFKQRQSLDYLRRLQSQNDVREFPVPGYLNPRLSHQQVELAAGEQIDVVLEVDPPPAGSGMHSVNVNAYKGDALLGGITAYVLDEGE